MKKNGLVKSIITLISVMVVMCLNNIPVYANGFVETYRKNNAIPTWLIVLGIIVVTGNIIAAVCKLRSGSNSGRDWMLQEMQQQQIQQQMQQQQNQLSQEQCLEQDRLFQEGQHRFQEEQFRNQWQDWNHFNNFNP